MQAVRVIKAQAAQGHTSYTGDNQGQKLGMRQQAMRYAEHVGTGMSCASPVMRNMLFSCTWLLP
jgi:hypothetical protein